MSLRTLPKASIDLSSLPLGNGLGLKDIAVDYLSIYLASLLTLSHGRRDLLELAAVWSASTCEVLITAEDSTDGFTVDFLTTIIDRLVTAGASACVCPVDYGRSKTLNAASILTEALALRPPDNEEFFLSQRFEAMSLPQDEVLVFRMLTKFSGVSAAVAKIAGDCLADGLSAAQANEKMAEGMLLVSSVLPSGFAHLMPLAVKALKAIYATNTAEEAWNAAAAVFCLDDTLKGKTLEEPPAYSTPADRMKRRSGGRASQDSRILSARNQVLGQSLTDVLGRIGVVPPTLPLAFSMVEAYLNEDFSEFVPITFMRPEAYSGFIKEGRFLSVWDMEDRGERGWHYRYSDIPVNARINSDGRLWGERGRDITYGAFLHRAATDQIGTLASMYGEVAVIWKPEVMKWASCCVNDSQCAPFALPATEKTLKRMLFPVQIARILSLNRRADAELAARLSGELTGVYAFPDFVEIQIHESLTPSHSVDVIGL